MYTNSRKAVTVYISKDVRYTSYDETSTKVRHSITVRYGWRKRIYSKFYEKGNLDAHHYFVLSAEEIRVNHPHIKLYEVQACGFKERKIMTMFVGQTTIGDCEATIKETSSEAIRAAKLLFEKQINNDLRRRNEDDERKA